MAPYGSETSATRNNTKEETLLSLFSRPEVPEERAARLGAPISVRFPFLVETGPFCNSADRFDDSRDARGSFCSTPTLLASHRATRVPHLREPPADVGDFVFPLLPLQLIYLRMNTAASFQ